MSTSLIASLEKAARKPRGKKKRRASKRRRRRATKRVRTVHVHHHHKPKKRKAAKRRRPRKGKLHGAAKRAFLARMARGRRKSRR